MAGVLLRHERKRYRRQHGAEAALGLPGALHRVRLPHDHRSGSFRSAALRGSGQHSALSPACPARVRQGHGFAKLAHADRHLLRGSAFGCRMPLRMHDQPSV